METKDIAPVGTDALFEKISALIEESRKRVATAVNVAEVYTKYEIGRYIVEDEQEGNYRAAYGKKVLEALSEKLTGKFGKGWTVESLTLTRKFYKTYLNSVNTVYEKSSIPSKKGSKEIVNTVYQIQNAPAEPHKFVLSWSHYLVLMRVDNPDARREYGIYTRNNN